MMKKKKKDTDIIICRAKIYLFRIHFALCSIMVFMGGNWISSTRYNHIYQNVIFSRSNEIYIRFHVAGHFNILHWISKNWVCLCMPWPWEIIKCKPVHGTTLTLYSVWWNWFTSQPVCVYYLWWSYRWNHFYYEVDFRCTYNTSVKREFEVISFDAGGGVMLLTLSWCIWCRKHFDKL